MSRDTDETDRHRIASGARFEHRQPGSINRDCCRDRAVIILSANAISHRRPDPHCRNWVIILLPILRVILMLIFFARERDYKFTAAAVVVLFTIFAGLAIGILAKQ